MRSSKAATGEPSEVARAKPAVVSKSLGGGLRILVITVEYHRAADQNLADAVLVRFDDLDLSAFHRFAHRSDAIVALVSRGRGAACFGQAVTLNDRKT